MHPSQLFLHPLTCWLFSSLHLSVGPAYAFKQIVNPRHGRETIPSSYSKKKNPGSTNHVTRISAFGSTRLGEIQGQGPSSNPLRKGDYVVLGLYWSILLAKYNCISPVNWTFYKHRYLARFAHAIRQFSLCPEVV